MITIGATPYQDAHDSAYSSEFLPFGELVLFRVPLPHSRRTNPNRTIYRGDGGWDKGFWCGRLDEDDAHKIVTESGRKIARTVRRLPPGQRVDVSLRTRVQELPWDGQRLVRRSVYQETLAVSATGVIVDNKHSRLLLLQRRADTD